MISVISVMRSCDLTVISMISVMRSISLYTVRSYDYMITVITQWACIWSHSHLSDLTVRSHDLSNLSDEINITVSSLRYDFTAISVSSHSDHTVRLLWDHLILILVILLRSWSHSDLSDEIIISQWAQWSQCEIIWSHSNLSEEINLTASSLRIYDFPVISQWALTAITQWAAVTWLQQAKQNGLSQQDFNTYLIR